MMLRILLFTFAFIISVNAMASWEEGLAPFSITGNLTIHKFEPPALLSPPMTMTLWRHSLNESPVTYTTSSGTFSVEKVDMTWGNSSEPSSKCPFSKHAERLGSFQGCPHEDHERYSCVTSIQSVASGVDEDGSTVWEAFSPGSSCVTEDSYGQDTWFLIDPFIMHFSGIKGIKVAIGVSPLGSAGAPLNLIENYLNMYPIHVE